MKKKKGYGQMKEREDRIHSKEMNINPNLPAQLMEDSCLPMDDMLFLVTCLHKLRTIAHYIDPNVLGVSDPMTC